MANYVVDPAILEPRVPSGTSLDLHEGTCYVSLVGFMFLNTRVLGIPIPFHVNFEEVNLRFYVLREVGSEVRRGVVFIKEIVPRRAIAAVARLAYGEPYECWRMSNRREGEFVSYSWLSTACDNTLSVQRGPEMGVPASGSHGEFIIEHYWGYTRRGSGRTDEYKVEHPKWSLFDTTETEIKVDFATTYGEEFGFLTEQPPHSVLLAAGSDISVYKGSPILT